MSSKNYIEMVEYPGKTDIDSEVKVRTWQRQETGLKVGGSERIKQGKEG